MGKKILVVDDEPGQILLLGTRLRANGYEVIPARDGEEGLKKALEEKPDLILLDILLPRMDGLEVCRRLKKGPETQGIPVILFTACRREGLEAQAESSGAEGFLEKPYRSTDLLDRMHELLGGTDA